MKKYESAKELADDMEIDAKVLKNTFNKYNDEASQGKDDYGKKYFQNTPFVMDDYFFVAIVCPVVHYCMGGLKVSEEAEVMTDDEPIKGLYATGEVCGGVHGKNRLGGSSLLDCVVFGRVSGRNVTKYLLQNASNNISKGGSNDKIFLTIGNTKINVDSNNKKITINWNENKESKKGSFKEIKNVENEVKEEKKEEKKIIRSKNVYCRRSCKT